MEYLDRAHAEQAIQRFNGQPFNGRPLAVSEARAREDRGPGGYSGPRPAVAVLRVRGRAADIAPRPSLWRWRARVRIGRFGAVVRPRQNFGPDAKPQRGAAAKKGKKGDERPRGPIPVKATRRSFTLDDDDATAVDEPLADIDNFATSKPEDKEIEEPEEPGDDESSRRGFALPGVGVVDAVDRRLSLGALDVQRHVQLLVLGVDGCRFR